MISIIIPSYRNPAYLDLCLDSLVSGQVNDNEIIVVVDGYVNENTEVMEKYPTVSWLTFDENQGMQAAINYGAWNASNEKLLIINDDNVFPNEWDVRIEKEYKPDTILTINQIEPTGPGMFNFPVVDCGKTVETFDMNKFETSELSLFQAKETPDGNIFPFLINKRWFMAVGGFDTFYNSPNWCDIDFFTKLELIPNLTRSRTHRVHVYHFGSVSTKKNSESNVFRQRESMAAEQYYYKWGHMPNLVENALQYNNTRLPKHSESFRGFSV